MLLIKPINRTTRRSTINVAKRNQSSRFNRLTFIVPVLCCLLAACEQTPRQQIIKEKIDAITEGIEARDPNSVLEQLDEHFSTPAGQDKQWVKRLLLVQMMRQQTIHVVLTNLHIEARDDYLTDASFNVLLTGGQGLLPQDSALYRVETQWRLQEDEWLLNYASWRKP